MSKEIEELISEARKCAPGDCSTELAVMVHRLADALESATRADAATEREIAIIEEHREKWMARAFRAEAERDDLATRLSEYLCDSTGGLLSKTGYDVRTMVTHTEEYYDKVHAEARKEVEAERDAAQARIAEVAKLRRRRDDLAYRWGGGPVCDGCGDEDGWASKWPCATIQALDGAPEPETAPENYEPKCNGACAVHGSPVTNWPVQYGRRNRETGSLHWLKGYPFDSWWHENQDRYEHVKRYTSPPLPVEGESK